jgi:DNA gyrase/topoisomerase IV subunit B
MKECNKYNISECNEKEKNKEYIKICFLPDDKFFKKTNINDIILKRLYDISGCNPKLSVYFNDNKIQIKSK